MEEVRSASPERATATPPEEPIGPLNELADSVQRLLVEWPPVAPWRQRLVQALDGVWRIRVQLLALFLVVGVALAIQVPEWALSAFLMSVVIGVTVTLSLALVYGVVVPPIGWLSLGPRWRWGLFHLVALGGAVALGVELALQLLELTLRFPAGELRFRVLPQSFLLAVLIVVGFALQGALEQRTREVAERERDALRARLDAIQARTDPHFLFNSLNVLAGLIEEDPRRAVRVVERLSALLRHSLEGSKRLLVPLVDEVGAVQSFLEIEGIRSGGRIRFSLDWEETLGSLLVPPHCLQPLVENAIRHGVGERREGGRIDVAIARQGEDLLLRVEDDGPGPRASTQRGTGTALADLRSRLRILFRDHASLEITEADGGGCRVTMRIPGRAARILDAAAATSAAPEIGS